MKKKINSITLLARRWFDGINGNTCFSCRIVVDGIDVHRIGFEYGSDSHYIECARDWLKKNKYLPYMRDREALWHYCARRDINLITEAVDVGRKKDL